MSLWPPEGWLDGGRLLLGTRGDKTGTLLTPDLDKRENAAFARLKMLLRRFEVVGEVSGLALGGCLLGIMISVEAVAMWCTFFDCLDRLV